MKIHAALTAATDSRGATRAAASPSPSQSFASGSKAGSSVRGPDSESPADEASASSESDLSESDPDIVDALHDPADSDSEGEEDAQPDPAALRDADIQQMQAKAQALRAQMKWVNSVITSLFDQFRANSINPKYMYSVCTLIRQRADAHR